jgi:hypothetical protein
MRAPDARAWIHWALLLARLRKGLRIQRPRCVDWGGGTYRVSSCDSAPVRHTDPPA